MFKGAHIGVFEVRKSKGGLYHHVKISKRKATENCKIAAVMNIF